MIIGLSEGFAECIYECKKCKKRFHMYEKDSFGLTVSCRKCRTIYSVAGKVPGKLEGVKRNAELDDSNRTLNIYEQTAEIDRNRESRYKLMYPKITYSERYEIRTAKDWGKLKIDKTKFKQLKAERIKKLEELLKQFDALVKAHMDMGASRFEAFKQAVHEALMLRREVEQLGEEAAVLRIVHEQRDFTGLLFAEEQVLASKCPKCSGQLQPYESGSVLPCPFCKGDAIFRYVVPER